MDPGLVSSVVDCILSTDISIIRVPTGTGKTTLIPIELMKRNKRIYVCLPTIYSSESIRTYVQRLEPHKDIGLSCNSKIEYDDESKLIYCTTGHLEGLVLSGSLKADVVILDEYHTGNISNTIIHHLWTKTRFVNHLVIISATFPTTIKPTIDIDIPKKYKVEIKYIPTSIKTRYQQIYMLINKHSKEKILVFLSTIKEVDKLYRYLNHRDIKAYKLHSKVLYDVSEINNSPDVVLATNIAESSVTISNLDIIIDTMIECRQIPSLKRDYIVGLEKTHISKLSALQRIGRLGRMKDGVCYRLCSELEYESLRYNNEPEINTISLLNTAFNIIRTGNSKHFKDIIDIKRYKKICKIWNAFELYTDGLGIDFRLNLCLKDKCYEYIVMCGIIEHSLVLNDTYDPKYIINIIGKVDETYNGECDLLNTIFIVNDFFNTHTIRYFDNDVYKYSEKNGINAANMTKICRTILRLCDILEVKEKKFDLRKIEHFMSGFNSYFNVNLFRLVNNGYYSDSLGIHVNSNRKLANVISTKILQHKNSFMFSFIVDPDVYFYVR